MSLKAMGVVLLLLSIPYAVAVTGGLRRGEAQIMHASTIPHRRADEPFLFWWATTLNTAFFALAFGIGLVALI